MPNRSVLAVLATIVMLLLPVVASAQAVSATEYLQDRHAELDTILARPAPTDEARAARDARASAIIDRLFDYDAFARGSLGTEWTARTPAEQQEFTALLTEHVQRRYRASLDRVREYQVTYLSEETTTGGVIVHTSLQSRAHRREPPITIDYVMHQVNGTWRATDFITDNASAVGGQAGSFRRIIARDGWPAFMMQLRERLAHPAG